MKSKPTAARPGPISTNAELDSYPRLDTIPEATLLYAYRKARRRTAPEPEKRPLGPVYDESGLAYGEPISKGRTGLQRGQP